MADATEKLPVIIRPNGKPYRPRKVIAHAVGELGLDDDCGVVVFGTHDIERARPLAQRAVGNFQGCAHAIRPQRVWWRDGFECGERRWIYDNVNGRAVVSFVASDDPEEVPGG